MAHNPPLPLISFPMKTPPVRDGVYLLQLESRNECDAPRFIFSLYRDGQWHSGQRITKGQACLPGTEPYASAHRRARRDGLPRPRLAPKAVAWMGVDKKLQAPAPKGYSLTKELGKELAGMFGG